MASLADAMKKLKYDKRLLDYNISQGSISKEEWAQYVNSLPDSSGNSEAIDVEANTVDALDSH